MHGAPADLAARTRELLPADLAISAATLAASAAAALSGAVAAGSDRKAALDLLAADALVTLALAAQVEADPARLAAFAASLLPAHPASA